MTLPADLLEAAAASGGGRLVLVVGAGASVEEPTGLPLSRECSLEAHRRLVSDGVLADGACPEPEDLSAVADAVVEATGGQQALVERLPLRRFQSAEPNEGCLVAAALLREGAVSCVLTLNFDLAMSAALSQVGADEAVGLIAGPEEHHRLSTVNLIYLHRNVNADPESWILRRDALDDEWRERWEEVVVQRVVAGPVTVFAGLGTPAAVLIETSRRIRAAIPEGIAVFQVDPGPAADSMFFSELGLSEDSYIQEGWCEFARELADRVVEEQTAELRDTCRELIAEEEWEDDDPEALCERLGRLGLVRIGRLRARWGLEQSPYSPRSGVEARQIADLLLAIGVVERASGATAAFEDDGVVEFRRGDRAPTPVLLASGRGSRRWIAVEARIAQQAHRRRPRDPGPRFALVGGVSGGRPEAIAAPDSVVRGPASAGDIIDRGTGVELVTIDELRESPELAERLAA
ncbi:MAG: hypothetical protein BroJett022_11190 [Actinomycetes bacterium]|nr:MAG: hypothetical protein BroJett022_11190 [Actinomycetes bacterium]